jgi:hypothetical protein
LTLGKWPDLGVDAARNVARARIGEIAHGKDPAKIQRETREVENNKLSAVLEKYEMCVVRTIETVEGVV